MQAYFYIKHVIIVRFCFFSQATISNSAYLTFYLALKEPHQSKKEISVHRQSIVGHTYTIKDCRIIYFGHCGICTTHMVYQIF